VFHLTNHKEKPLTKEIEILLNNDTIILQINPCVKIPAEYYIQDKVTINKDVMSKVTVPRGGSHQLSYDITHPGTVIRYFHVHQ